MSFRTDETETSNLFSGRPKKKLQTKEELEMEFIQSGERQRLGELVSKRLKETGWVSEVETLCRKYVAEHVSIIQKSRTPKI